MERGATVWMDFDQAQRRMAEIIIDASLDPRVIQKAVDVLQDLVAGGDYPSEAAALAYVARDCIRYTSDPSGEDAFKYPLLTLQQQAGDCNNKVVLFASLARSMGFPIQLAFVFSRRRPDPVHDFPMHVFCMVDVYKGERERPQWVPCELTPLPDELTGYPTQTLAFGELDLPEGSVVRYFDVDAYRNSLAPA